MKTKIFTGLTVDLSNIVAITDLMREEVPPKNSNNASRNATAFYIYLKYVPNPVRTEVEVTEEIRELAKLNPKYMEVPAYKEGDPYALDTYEKNAGYYKALNKNSDLTWETALEVTQARLDAFIREWQRMT